MSTDHGWTDERRARAAELCRRHRPWEKATGPRSAAGKARASLNGCRGDTGSELFKAKLWARTRRLEMLGVGW